MNSLYCRRTVSRIIRYNLFDNLVCYSLKVLMPLCLTMFLLIVILFISGCSLDGFKEFKVNSTSIQNGEVIGTDKGSIEIIFNKDVDSEAAYNSIRVEEEGGNQIAFELEINGCSVIILPNERWQPHKRYWLILDKELSDTFGKKMDRSFFLSFISTKEEMPVSAIIVEPDIKNGIVNKKVEYIEVGFSDFVDGASIERAFSLSPGIEGDFIWPDNKTFKYMLKKGITKNEYYTVAVSNKGLDSKGYNIKSLSKGFEYFPNTDLPEINTLLIDGLVVFDREDNFTFEEDGASRYIAIDNVEKDFILRINFTNPIDKSSFEEGFNIEPAVDWEQEWTGENTVNVTFKKNLTLERSYKLSVGNEIKNQEGLFLRYNYIINAEVLGRYSRYLEFYAEDFVDLEITASLMAEDTSIAQTGFNIGRDNDGSYIRINYDDTHDPGEIDVDLIITARFSSPEYIPVIKKNTLQDAVIFDFVMGTNSESLDKIGNLAGFNWIDVNECKISLSGAGTDNVYHLHVGGSTNGVIDEHNNYLKDDIDYYFKLVLIKD